MTRGICIILFLLKVVMSYHIHSSATSESRERKQILNSWMNGLYGEHLHSIPLL